MNAISRAIGSLFPKDAEKIQNPMRRSAVQSYNKMAADPTMQFLMRGSSPEQMQSQMRQMGAPQQPEPSPHGQIRPMSGRERVAEAFNRVIPKPIQKVAQFIGDPLEMVDQPLGAGKAMMGLRTRAKNLGLQTKHLPEHFGTRSIHVIDPEMQTRYLGKSGVNASGGKDAHGIHGGDIGAYIDYHVQPELSSQGADMFRMETGLELKSKPPSYKVDFAQTLERQDPRFPRDPFKKITVEPAYSGEAFEELLRVGAKEHPGKIYTIEAELINNDLVRLANNFGIVGLEHGYGPMAVYFAKNGRLLPTNRAMKALGKEPEGIFTRSVDTVVHDYSIKKKAAKQAQREQALAFQKYHRNMTKEEAANAAMANQPSQQAEIDWMGEGQPPARTPREQEPIGFEDTPPWLREFAESTPQPTRDFRAAFDDAMSMHHAEGVSPSGIQYELHVNGYPDDVIREVMREVRKLTND